MTDDGNEWDWLRNVYIQLTFARGVSPERVIEAFGSDPADARLLTQDEANDDPGFPFARFGRSGEWAFALDDGCADPWESQRIETALSAGTEVVTYEINPARNYFRYYADGIEVTSFEPLLAHERYGSDPDRFVPLMRQVGLRTDLADDDDDFRDPSIALLEMLTLAFGIRLSLEESAGPLLTVRPPLHGAAMQYAESREVPTIEVPDELPVEDVFPSVRPIPGGPRTISASMTLRLQVSAYGPAPDEPAADASGGLDDEGDDPEERPS
jgi:hypothetical protein